MEGPEHFHRGYQLQCQADGTQSRKGQPSSTHGDAKSRRHQDDLAVLSLVTQTWDYQLCSSAELF